MHFIRRLGHTVTTALVNATTSRRRGRLRAGGAVRAVSHDVRSDVASPTFDTAELDDDVRLILVVWGNASVDDGELEDAGRPVDRSGATVIRRFDDERGRSGATTARSRVDGLRSRTA